MMSWQALLVRGGQLPAALCIMEGLFVVAHSFSCLDLEFLTE